MPDDDFGPQFTIRLLPDDCKRVKSVLDARRERDPYVTLADVLRALMLTGLKETERRS